MISSFRHVGVVVKDMESAMRFYCDYLEHEVIVDFIEKGDYFNRLIGLVETEARVVKVHSPDGIYLELIEFLNHPVVDRDRIVSPVSAVITSASQLRKSTIFTKSSSTGASNSYLRRWPPTLIRSNPAFVMIQTAPWCSSSK